MDMARVLIIKTPQKYKKTTHSARISHLFCVYFLRLFLMVGGMEGWGMDVGGLMYGREQKVGFAEKKLRLWLAGLHRVYHGWHVTTCGRAFVCGCVI